MTPGTVTVEVDAAARNVQAGALLLRLLAAQIGKGGVGLEAAAPQILQFIANGLLDQSARLENAVEDASIGSEGAA